jgi:hypothetical protein
VAAAVLVAEVEVRSTVAEDIEYGNLRVHLADFIDMYRPRRLPTERYGPTS